MRISTAEKTVNELKAKKKGKKTSPNKKILHFIAYLIAFLWIVPLIWMVLASIKPSGSAVTIIPELITPPFTMSNYEYVLEFSSVSDWTVNSFVVSIITTVFVLFLNSLAAFALSKTNFPFKKIIFVLIMGGLMVPIEAIIIPLFELVNNLGLINTYLSLILPGLANPLGVFILKQFYDDIPNELVEAARIDGASNFRIYWNIFLPLSKSSLAAVGILTFVRTWNEFLWPFLSITQESMMTLPVGIPTFQNAYTAELMIPMAANMLASLPAILVFIFFQKNIIKGITRTGIK